MDRENGANGERRFPVAVTAAQERTFEERIVVQGTLLAKTYAMVAPRVDGILTMSMPRIASTLS